MILVWSEKLNAAQECPSRNADVEQLLDFSAYPVGCESEDNRLHRWFYGFLLVKRFVYRRC
jgi:hypothetical protein